MKKILCFIFDVISIMGAFILTDVVMYNLQSEDLLTDFLVFLGFSIVLEGGTYLITKLVKLR